MARPKLPIFDVVAEALGFACLKFGNALRIAWLPIVLMLGLQVYFITTFQSDPTTIIKRPFDLDPGTTFAFIKALQGVSWQGVLYLAAMVGLKASMMTALIKYAASGEAPHHRSAHLSFGLVEAKYIIANAISFAGVILAFTALVFLGYRLMDASVIPALNAEVAVFETGSLHSVELEQAHASVRGMLDQVTGFYKKIGLDVTAIESIILVPVSLAAGYVLLRLFPLPYFAAARPIGASITSLGATLRLTGGWNVVPLFVVLIIFGVLSLVWSTVLLFAVGVFNTAWASIASFVDGYERLIPESTAGGVVTAIMWGIAIIIHVAATTFVAAVTAGIGGALVHRGSK